MDYIKPGGSVFTAAGNDTRSNQASRRIVCLPMQNAAFKGIWFREDPLDHPYPLLLAQTILVLLTSRVLYVLLKPLGQTKFVCNLLGGIILGPSLLSHNTAFRDKLLIRGKRLPLFDTIARLGLLYSLFIITVKFDIGMVKRTVKNSWKIVLAGFIFPSAVTSALVYTMGSTIPGIEGGTFFLFFVTFTLPFTYFPVVAEALDEFNLMASELGQLAMSSSVINDVLQWIFTVEHLIVTQRSTINGVKTFTCFLELIFFTVFVISPAIKRIIQLTPEGQEVKEGYVIAIQVGVLVMAFFTDVIGMKPIPGPILLGLVIPSGPPLGAALVHKTELLVSEFLLPVFFFLVGFTVNVYSVDDWASFKKLQLIIVVSYVAKIVGVTVTALSCKMRFRHSFLLSMIMSMKGILELVVYGRWYTLKALDEQCFSQIILSSLALTMVASPLVRFLYTPHGELKAILPRVRNIQSTPRNSDMFRILCCFHNKESVPNIITLLAASNPTQESPICAYVVHAVGLSSRAAPLLVPCSNEKQRSKFRRKNSTTRQITQAFENYSKISTGKVVIQAYTMNAPYKCMHESLFRIADDKFVPLILITFHENHPGVVGPSMMAAIRQFNTNVQLYSSCTVGILVDRGLSCQLTTNSFSCNVALFFIGGPDDREALAYAARMSGNPNVYFTVLRITLRNKLKEWNEEVQAEAKLDQSLVDEFNLRNMGNDRLNWQEIEVNDCVQLMDAVINLQGEYELVMVGRRHTYMTLMDEEMAGFVENAELEVIGDIIASSYFCGGTVNMLVIQESMELGCGVFRSESTKESESGLSNMATQRLLP